jgi:putative glutamine amidotransferase
VASNDSDLPVVGLTTYLERARQGVWDVRASFLPQQYFEAVTSSGAAAVLLPPQAQPERAAEVVLDGLDGLVLTGGLDVQPELYPARPDRDAWELALLAGAQRRGMPVFGICRGLQLINVALGGTLHQHLPEALGTEVAKALGGEGAEAPADRYRIGGGVFAENTVEVAAGSRLAELIGAGDYGVHSYHHQGIDRVGAGVVVSATTDDGLVQAFEAPGDDFLVAVQWHPEENSSDRRLFEGLVAAAGAYRASRAGGVAGAGVPSDRAEALA